MRKEIITSMALLAALTSASAKDKVIEDPSLKFSSTPVLGIDEIILGDTATTVKFSIEDTPGKTFTIASGAALYAGGQKYAYTSCSGITPDMATAVPAEGELHFTMNFKPVPSGTKTVDFKESESDKGWSIWGIHLDGKKEKVDVPAELRKQKLDREQPLPAIVPSYGYAEISGRLLGYSTDMNFSVSLTSTDMLTLNDETVDCTLSPDGSFTGKVMLCATAPIYLNVGEHRIELLASPGKSASVTVSLPGISEDNDRDDAKSIWFEGELSAFNDEYNSLDDDVTEKALYKWDFPEFKSSGIVPFKEKQLKTLNLIKATIDSDKNLSSVMKNYLKARTELAASINIITAPLLYRNMTQGKEAEVPADYYDEVISMNAFNNKFNAYTSMAPRLAQLTVAIARNNEKLYNLFKDNSELIPQLTYAQTVAKQFADFTPVSDEIKEAIKGNSPAFADKLFEMNDEVVARIEANKSKTGYTVHDLDENLKGADVFNNIISQFKGKPILVDFWATWCGPCRMGMKTIEPLKQEMAGKVTFVYVSGVTSPKNLWQNMIPDIHGEHFYVTAEQWQTLLSQFESQGIPTYVVVDKDGNVQSKFIGFPGNDKLKEEFEKALAK